MEDLSKGFVALATIFAVYKIIADVLLARSVKHRDEYEFTKDFLSDLENDKSHRYVLEKGFRALTGDIYRVEEIRHLLSLDEPSRAIFLRASTKNTIHFNPTEMIYEWKNLYSCKCFRWLAKKLYLVFYGISAFIAMSPLIISSSEKVIFNFNVMTSLSFFIIAIFFVIKHTDFIDTLDFMRLVEPTNKSTED